VVGFGFVLLLCLPFVLADRLRARRGGPQGDGS